VIAGSPAARCGLHDDDVITQLDSTSIDALKPLWDYLAHCKPGQRVRVRVQRGAHELNLELELAAPVEY
jgi:S1-C subfamily serine protease